MKVTHTTNKHVTLFCKRRVIGRNTCPLSARLTIVRSLGDGWAAALWNISVLDSRENYKIDGFRDEDHTATATFIFPTSVSGEGGLKLRGLW